MQFSEDTVGLDDTWILILVAQILLLSCAVIRGEEEEIIAALTTKPHALQVAHDTGWSFATA